MSNKTIGYENPFAPPAPYQPPQRRNGHAIAGYTLAIITGVAGVAAGYIGYENVAERDATIRSQSEQISSLEDELADTADELDTAVSDRDECEAEATAYYNSLIAMTDEMSYWVSVYPFGTLDLSEATEYVDEANELGCI